MSYLRSGATVLRSGTSPIRAIPDIATATGISFTHLADAVAVRSLYIPDATEKANWLTVDPPVVLDDRPRISAMIELGSGGRPYLRDQGPYGEVYMLDFPFPGPLYIGSSTRFGGRPAWNCDELIPPDITHGFYSMMSPNNGSGPPVVADYFGGDGYDPPYWTVNLSQAGHAMDSTQGGLGTGPTIGTGGVFGTPGKWSVACWGLDQPGGDPPEVINNAHDAAPTTETVLVIVHNSGSPGTSFLEVTWRDAANTLITSRANGTLDTWPYLEAFLGWVDEHAYGSIAAITTGSPTEAQLTAIRAYCAPWMPPAAVRASEP